ncbi:MAG TPA: Ldh family oxidoreductase [Isosphaeraceae bacterium]|nr:Ldh family oxidoreductase [Isosphaeraceae bacterium]
MPTIAAGDLTDFVAAVFEGAGVAADEARTVAESLVGANLRGHDSHGVMRVAQYVDRLREGAYRSGVELRVERETPAVVVCDGQWGLGQVQAHRLLDKIIPKARALGLGAGAARAVGHIGRLGEYAERAAAEGLVLLATVNTDGAGQRVAPPGGREGRLGTNPLCIGVPTAGDPVVLDFGTSAAAEGKVRVYYIDGRRPVPEGWLLDHEGKPTTDPASLYEPPVGTLLPMGGAQAYKGFGLSLVLDMLAGGLTGGRTCHPDPAPVRGNNVVFVALEPDLFAGRDALVREATTLADHVRACPRAEGVEAILLPGDPERRALRQRSTSGITLPDAHWAKLAEVARGLGVAVPV